MATTLGRMRAFAGRLAVCLLCATASATALAHLTAVGHADVEAVPLNFEHNVGQAPAGVQYLARGRHYSIALSNKGAALALDTPAGTGDLLRLEVKGAGSARAPIAEAPLAGRINYLIGNDPAKWMTNIPTYGKVRYQGVYPGVDLVYYGTAGRLEYDFALAPHADPSRIALRFAGADGISLDPRGALRVRKGAHEVRFEQPVAYQLAGGRRVGVPVRYRIDGNVTRFELGPYDRARALTIDPVLSYFSYLGGSAYDSIGTGAPQQGTYGSGNTGSQAAGIDAAGDLYVAGYTNSTNFPTQSPVAPAPTKTAGTIWAFVSKFAPDAKSLVFSTYLGGTNGDDYGYGLAVDAAGNAFVAGRAGSSDFPTTANAYLRICSPTYVNSPNNPYSGCGSGNYESFIAKLSPNGALLASTFLGGTHTLSSAVGVAIDAAGRPYVVGTTLPGEDIPSGLTGMGINQAVGFQTTAGAVVKAYPYIQNVPVNGALQYDAYVGVFDPGLTTLLYSTLVGDDRPQDGSKTFSSQGPAYGAAIAVDGSGRFYLAGWTIDAYLPTTSGAYHSAPGSCGPTITDGSGNVGLAERCGFVAGFSAVGGASPPAQLYTTYLGGTATGVGSGEDDVSGIAVDSAGDAYVVGYANDAGFPTTTGAYQTTCNGYNGTNAGNTSCSAAFIAELNPSGSTLLASTYLGCATCSGDAMSDVSAVVLDGTGNVYLAGIGNNGLPVVGGFASTNVTGGQGPYIAVLDPTLSTLKFSTFVNVGNAGQINTSGLAVDATGAIYLAGSVNSPATSGATPGAVQAAYGGGSSDGFVARIVPAAPTTTVLVVAPGTANAGTTVTFTATVSGPAGGATPTGTVTFLNGANSLGSGTLNSSGVATFSTSSLAVGSYSVTASYGGDANDSASTSAASSLTIATPPPAPTVSLTVSPTSVTQGQGATLTWSSTNATACTASGSWSGAQATSGTQGVTPAAAGNFTYTLTCTGAGGSANASAALAVAAAPMPTVTFSVAPASITVGQSATLTWSSTDATSCTASGSWTGTQAVSGNQSVKPPSAGQSVYSIACTGTGGTANASATLTVNAAPASSSGGGGAMDWADLLLLLGAVGAALQWKGRRAQ